ncbi:MAG: hypothetical protein WCA00_22080 [Candidatus Acidiferrales bacterium]
MTATAAWDNTGRGGAMEAGARKLSTHQKAVLIQVLRTFPEQRVNVCYQRAASDAGDYAQDFLTIFKVIGWDAKEGAPAENWTSAAPGLSLVVAAPGSLPPCAEALRDALRIYGIEVATVCDPACGVQAGGFIFAVGAGESRDVGRDAEGAS